jgi:hypothetical protein
MRGIPPLAYYTIVASHMQKSSSPTAEGKSRGIMQHAPTVPLARRK